MNSRLSIVAILIALCPLLALGQENTPSDFHSWAKTPPMGWNSWDCFGPSVVEDEVKANADYMAANLKEYGWEYVVVDIRWYIDNQTTGHYNAYSNSDFVIDEYGRYQPSPKRFPSSADGTGFKSLADYVHGLGLKFGIHIMRGVPKEAVFNKLPILGTSITADQIYSTAYECTWLQDNYTVLKSKEGAQEYYNSIFDLYAEWGVDFVKIDDLSRPYHTDEIEMIRQAIDQTGRKMVLSMSPGATPVDEHAHAQSHANMWRTIDDFWDNWSQLNYSFEKCAEWAPYISEGAWPDADMLPMGHLSIRGERGEDRYTNFTANEQYTLMTLWSIFKSPLMFGGHMPDNDEFTHSLLTNTEVLNMHATSVNNLQWKNENNIISWLADDPMTGDKYLAVFNNEGDGFVSTKNLLYRSGTVSTLTDGYGVNIDISLPENSNELYLIVNDGGDNFNCDHADWINPMIYFENGDSASLTTLNWASATAGWGTVQLNKSISGNTLNVKGTAYSKGLGTHSRSIIKYILPENTIRFKTFAGLDIGGTNQGCGSTVEFMISNQDPTPTQNDVDSLLYTLDIAALGYPSSCNIRDLWAKEDLGTFAGTDFEQKVPTHGARLFRISPNDRFTDFEFKLTANADEILPTDSLELTTEFVLSGTPPTGWIQIYQGDSLLLNTEMALSYQLKLAPLAEGTYTFTANYSGDETHETKTTEALTINVKKKSEALSNDEENFEEWAIFPNPATDKLYFTPKKNEVLKAIKITNISGAKVLTISDEAALAQQNIDISDLTKGVYFVEMISEKSRSSFKFIKE